VRPWACQRAAHGFDFEVLRDFTAVGSILLTAFFWRPARATTGPAQSVRLSIAAGTTRLYRSDKEEVEQ